MPSPNLTASTHLAAVEVPPGVAGVSDASGNDITSYKDAGLTNIAGLLEQKAHRGRHAPQQLDGRLPAVHRQDPGHRQQRRR
jgi:hypothetical protein